MAKVQRLVGIDFGTSTSIVKVKRYEGDSPVGDSHTSSSVTFGNGESDTKAVTVVRLNQDGTATCGTEALDQIPGSTVCQEFKMDLESPDREKRRQAMGRTEDYFRYLYSWYDHQRSDLGAIDDEECTLVSYPVKWRPETRAYLLKTARNAGFRNVSGMDEPTAALYATLCRKMSEINQQGLLRAGESGYMLLVDMGAGTTDLAVCRYRVKAGDPVIRVDQIENEIIAAWPMDSGAATFGGREVDRVLEEYIIDHLKNCGFPAENAEQAVRGSGNSSTAAKRWKETTVSKTLNGGKKVESCAFVNPFMMFLPQAKPFPAFGRREFEAMLGEKVEDFKNLVAGCLAQVSRAEPDLLAKKLDLVILTGGHSAWYFVEELLSGAMPGLPLPQLELVQRERSRVIRLTNPQETVALGLVYSRLPFQVAAPEPELEPEPEPQPEPERISAPEPSVSGGPVQNHTAPPDNTPNAGKDLTAKVAKAVATHFLGKRPVAAIEKLIAGKPPASQSGSGAAEVHANGGAVIVPPAPEKWPTNDQLAMCVKEFMNHYETGEKSVKTLTRGSLATLRKKLRVPDSDEVFLYHDDTTFNAGKSGFVFCTSGIITNGLVSKRPKRFFVSWLSFATGSLRPFEVDGPILFCDSAGVVQALTSCTAGSGYTKADMHRFLSALQAHLMSRFNLKTIPKKMGLKDAGSVSNEQLAGSALAFITSYDQSVIQRISEGKPAAAAKNLKIPADAAIYLCHDNSDTETGKLGFAVTSRGIYCLISGFISQHIFTDWRTFFANSLELNKDGMLCRCSAIDGVTKTLAYEGLFSTADTFVFFAHLHAYLRELYI